MNARGVWLAGASGISARKAKIMHELCSTGQCSDFFAIFGLPVSESLYCELLALNHLHYGQYEPAYVQNSIQPVYSIMLSIVDDTNNHWLLDPRLWKFRSENFSMRSIWTPNLMKFFCAVVQTLLKNVPDKNCSGQSGYLQTFRTPSWVYLVLVFQSIQLATSFAWEFSRNFAKNFEFPLHLEVNIYSRFTSNPAI